MHRMSVAVSIMAFCALIAQGQTKLSYDSTWACLPQVAWGDAGDQYLAVWVEVQGEYSRIRGRRFDSNLDTLGGVINLSSREEEEYEFFIPWLDVTARVEDFCMVCECQFGGSRIYGAVVYPDTVQTAIPLVNYGERPAVAPTETGYLVVWHRDLDGMLCCQKFSTALTPLSNIQQVDNGDYPRLVSNGAKNLLLYVKNGVNPKEVWGTFNPSVSSNPFKIADGPCEGWPDVAWHADSAVYLVAFRNTAGRLVSVLVDSSSLVEDPVVLAEDVPSDSLSVAASGMNFLVPWQHEDGPWSIRGQRVNPVGQAVGPQESILENSANVDFHDPDVASDGNLFAVVYRQIDLESEPDKSVIYVIGVSPYQEHFYSRSEHATAFNQSQHIARDPETGELHIVYTAGGQQPEPEDSVLYTHSTNNGEDWFPYEYVGEGCFPAVIANEVSGFEPSAWVAYVGADSSIVRAIRHGEGNWTCDTIFETQSSEKYAEPPSLAPAYVVPYENVPAAYVVYLVHDGQDHKVYFNFFTEQEVEPESVLATSATADFPSVAMTPGAIAHVSWQQDNAIYYRMYEDSAWSDTVRVTTTEDPVSEPADHAALEAYGDSVFCVWRGPEEDSAPGDIWRRSRWLQYPPHQWHSPVPQNRSLHDESDFPVMSAEYVSAWQEEVDNPNSDIWARFGENDPEAIFETEHSSRFPHVASYWESDPPAPQRETLHCLTVWTEATEDPETYEVMFGDYVHTVQTGFDAAGYEPGTYYGVEVGGAVPSRYCTRRGGFREYRLFRVDTSASELTYVLPYLNPRCFYVLRAVLFHEGNETWTTELRGDSSAWARLTARPNVPETVWVRIPQQSYRKDARIVLSLRRVSGSCVSLAGLKLFQSVRQHKGFELALSGGRSSPIHLFKAGPNPFRSKMAVHYGLALPGRARLDIVDASGRVVCKLVDADLAAGEYRVSWGGRDGQGRAVAAGVYFCRLQTPDAAAIDRVVLLR